MVRECTVVLKIGYCIPIGGEYVSPTTEAVASECRIILNGGATATRSETRSGVKGMSLLFARANGVSRRPVPHVPLR